MEAVLASPGPITVETIVGAGWQSPRAGLLDLTHTRAQELADGPEPVNIYVHALQHATRGLYLIDTGVEQALVDANHPLRTGAVGQAFGFAALEVARPLAPFLGDRRVAGVLLTHLHLDHLLGLPDLAPDVPLFVGPAESDFESAFHALTQDTVDALLVGRPPLLEWAFEGEGVIDVFGDASLFALAQPGHTPGSVAFVARTPDGPVLFTGDVCHTAWGWRNDVGPGTFSSDRVANAESLAALRALAARHPALRVRLGHQEL
jgi:glyoxylase-like metal-dependent hydrolase (beta-lactamase superfamily II)